MSMRKLKPLTEAEQAEVYARVYQTAFPPAELRPLWSMRQLEAAGRYRTMGWFEGGEALGYASLWMGDDERYILLDYFVVPEEKRNRGVGAALLQALLEYHPEGAVLMIESEAPAGDPAGDVMALRRLAFYRRCGAAMMGFDSMLFGVHYKIFALSRAEIDEARVLERYDALYRRQFYGGPFWDRGIRIPFREGGEIPAFKAWGEKERTI